jgi:hypothetical protein
MMAERPGINAPVETQVEIRVSEGAVSVKSPALFGTGDDHLVHTLIERLFRMRALKAVSVDRRQLTIEIEYDRAEMDCRSALREFSESLSLNDPVRTTIDTSLVRQYLDRVPGRVRRVERRVPDEVELQTVVVPTGRVSPDSPARHLTSATRAETGGAFGHSRQLPAEAPLVVENLVVEYDPDSRAKPNGGPHASVLQNLSVAGSLPSDVTKPWVGEVVIGGVRRIVNLTAAGGCLVMSVIGVVTPGIPTVPFVLATGYFLARSSPRLHERFRHSRFFGQMVSDYEDRGGLRWSTKINTILFTVGLMVVTVVIAGASLPLLIVVGTMGTIGIYVLGRIPTVGGGLQPVEATPAVA